MLRRFPRKPDFTEIGCAKSGGEPNSQASHQYHIGGWTKARKHESMKHRLVLPTKDF
jgi:hypothetical protein